MKSVALYVAASLLLTGLTACETPDDQAIAQARACVNNAAKLALMTPPDTAGAVTAAQTCETNLNASGVTSPQAMSIKFGAILIEDQIMENLVTAAQDLKSNPNNQAGMASMLPILLPVPPTGSTKEAESQKLVSTANGAGSSGMVYIASLVGMAVTLTDIAGGLTGGSTSSQVQTIVNNCSSTGGSGTITSGPDAGQQCSDLVAPLFTSLSSAACASPYDQTSTDPHNLCYQSKQIMDAAQTAAGGGTPTNAQITAALAAYLGTLPH